MKTAIEILEAGAKHMRDRADTYDSPTGEHSVPPAVTAFNALTGHNITAEQGWLFMALVKACRSQQGLYKRDNYEDGSSYFALAGEQGEMDRSNPSQLADKIKKSDSAREGKRITDVDWNAITYTMEHLWTSEDWQSISCDEYGDWHAHETTDVTDLGTRFPNQEHIRAIIRQLYPEVPEHSEHWVIMRPVNKVSEAVPRTPWDKHDWITCVARDEDGEWTGFEYEPIRGDQQWAATHGRFVDLPGWMDQWAERFDITPGDDWETTLITKNV